MTAIEKLLSKFISSPVSKILDRNLEAAAGGLKSQISSQEADLLFKSKGRDVQAICMAADEMRKISVGDPVTYVVNRNINFTNVCVKRCGFCAFSRTGIDQEGYFLPMSEILRRAKQAHGYGASEICIQAGLPPNMDGKLYPEIAAEVKSALPDIHLHAFSPEEVKYGASRLKVSIKDYIKLLKESGVDSLPGTSAEILDDKVRHQLAGARLSSAEWEHIITSAHEAGLNTTATIMYGHIEDTMHKANHLLKIREIQQKTGGITEFVPLSFVAAEAPIYKESQVKGIRDGPGGDEVLKMHAISRLMLHGHINNIQVSWVKEGLRMAQVLLNCGVNDLGGTLLNESISTAAGAGHGQMQSPTSLQRVAWEAGRYPVERFTNYTPRRVFHTPEESAEDSKLDAISNIEKEFGSFPSLVKSSEYRYRIQPTAKRNKAMNPNLRRPFSTFTSNKTQSNAESKRVTFSSSYTLVPTYECFNVCTYCNFRKQPGKDPWMTLEFAEKRLKELKKNTHALGPYQVQEILVMSGEIHPKSPRRPILMERVRDICQLALENGFWPHTNVGPLSLAEMTMLKEVNTSMGLMLEQATKNLMNPVDGVHRSAPSKRPEVRINQLHMAGELGIPFTTGILLGIGESYEDSLESLEVIAEIHERYKNIQECIIQPYSQGSTQKTNHPGFDLNNLPGIVKAARQILPSDIVVQVPPNLVSLPYILLACLEAGARDLGGISPKDEVNPDFAFPKMLKIKEMISNHGFELWPRLPVHQQNLHLLPSHLSQLLGQ
mmetsp:Transcript_28509/g.37293  ORF Transcript_28509/g.37293 Transcript_28509/m.37293 type:complete len:776 (+) Transcript_28509:110-2437(+)